MTKKRKVRKSKKERQNERGKMLIIIGVIVFLSFTFFGGDSLISAKSNIENYLGSGILIINGLIFAYGTFLIYKSIKR